MTLRTLALSLAALASSVALAVPPAPLGLQVPGGGTEPAPPGTVPWEVLQQARTVQRADKKFGPLVKQLSLIMARFNEHESQMRV